MTGAAVDLETVSTLRGTSRASDYAKIGALRISSPGLQLTVVRCIPFGYAAAVKNAGVRCNAL